MYATYEYYTDVYHGTQITAEEWPHAAQHAEAYLNNLTYNRLQNGAEVTNAVRMAVCAVAEVVQRHEAQNTARPGGIASENVDGYSVSYVDGTAQRVQQQCELRDAAGVYLPPSDPLRYAGV